MIAKKLNSEWLSKKEIKKIFLSLDNKARFVGGCVRDSIIGERIKDIDIATVFSPEEVINRLNNSGIKTIPTGVDHGSIVAIVNNQSFDITTLRKDIKCDGRHAEIKFTNSWEEDAARRDFTINALSCDIDGNIYDYFNGLEDLQNGIISFVGDASKRCSEDILRILRFFRFFAYYSKGAVDNKAIAACCKFAPYIKDLSGERIESEMIKILSAKNPLHSLELMLNNEILKYVISDNINLKHLTAILHLEKENIIKEISPLLRISSLIITNPKKEITANNVCRKWKTSNKFKKQLSFLVNTSNINKNIPIKKQKLLIYEYGKENFINLLYLSWSKESNLFDNETLDSYKNIISLCLSWAVPIFPISGKDLIALGFNGIEIGKKINIAKKHWQESEFLTSKESLLELIK